VKLPYGKYLYNSISYVMIGSGGPFFNYKTRTNRTRAVATSLEGYPLYF
jgi:hypothetical protein